MKRRAPRTSSSTLSKMPWLTVARPNASAALMSAMNVTSSAASAHTGEATCRPAGRGLWACRQAVPIQAASRHSTRIRRQRTFMRPAQRAVQAEREAAWPAQRAVQAERASLSIVAAVVAQELQLTPRLDALGDDFHPEAASHLDDGAHDGGIAGIVGRIAHEGLVDLQGADRKLLQGRQR